MWVVFRVDSSIDIGTGHVMRCLTLGEHLKEAGAAVSFICRDLPGNLIDFIKSRGVGVRTLPAPPTGMLVNLQRQKYASWLGVDWQEDAAQTVALLEQEPETVDWLIVDHYALDEGWEHRLRPLARKIMVIDDLADRPHDCDLLLDQNYYADLARRYDELTPPRSVKLLGPRYALLRPEFLRARRHLRERDGRIRRIMVFFGGSDPGNDTAKALESLQLLNRPEITINVVIGSANPHKEEIRRKCAGRPDTVCHCNVSNMAELMAEADLFIGAGGTTTWERCCLGLPSVIICIAANQEETSRDLADQGIILNLGPSDGVTSEEIYLALEKLLNDSKVLLAMAQRSAALVDGQGATKVAAALLANAERQEYRVPVVGGKI